MALSRLNYRWLLLITLLMGCGGHPERAAVSGRVTVDGKPVPLGRIMFWPAKGRPATAAIEEDGVYRLTTFDANDGATLGTHAVAIEAKCAVVKGKMPSSMAAERALLRDENYTPDDVRIHWLAPERFSVKDTSGLTAEVKAGENKIDFDLPGT